MRLRALWARGKDTLALRLRAAMCEAAGLPPPPVGPGRYIVRLIFQV